MSMIRIIQPLSVKSNDWIIYWTDGIGEHKALRTNRLQTRFTLRPNCNKH